jgi:hypothetical protein
MWLAAAAGAAEKRYLLILSLLERRGYEIDNNKAEHPQPFGVCCNFAEFARFTTQKIYASERRVFGPNKAATHRESRQ